MLPGLFIGPGMAAGGGPVGFSLISSEYIETLSTPVSFPTGIQAGDLLIGFAASLKQSAFRTASGFTSWRFVSSAVLGSFAICHKVATGSESGSTGGFLTQTVDGDPYGSGSSSREACWCFRGLNSWPAASGDLYDSRYDLTASNPSSKTAATVGSTKPTLALGFYSATSEITSETFTGATEDGTSDLLGSRNVILKWKLFGVADTLADITIDMGDHGTQNIVATIVGEVT